ncbi:MAG: hypothetical protein JWP26_1012 [Devosia sp.]|nr:hypothetical protein [Devosia sp.]MDB5586042.1 hypothetical protein [Devosia sp.]
MRPSAGLILHMRMQLAQPDRLGARDQTLDDKGTALFEPGEHFYLHVQAREAT